MSNSFFYYSYNFNQIDVFYVGINILSRKDIDYLKLF